MEPLTPAEIREAWRIALIRWQYYDWTGHDQLTVSIVPSLSNILRGLEGPAPIIRTATFRRSFTMLPNKLVCVTCDEAPGWQYVEPI